MNTRFTLDMASFKQAMSDNLEKHHRLYFFEGLLFVFLGIVSILMPYIAAEITMLVVGTLIVTAGISQLFFNLKGRRQNWVLQISAIMSIGFGLAILFWPEQGAIALATLVAVFLLVKGVSEMFVAFSMAPAKGWIFALLSGLLTLILSAIIWAGWPATSVWFLGIMIGLNFGMFGISMANIAWNYKHYIQAK